MLIYTRLCPSRTPWSALIRDGSGGLGVSLRGRDRAALTPLVERLAHRIGALDEPTDRPRVHVGAGPAHRRARDRRRDRDPGGAVRRLDDGPYPGILIGTLCIAALGLVDDIRGLRPRDQDARRGRAVALIPVVGCDLTFDHVTLPLIGDHDLGWVGLSADRALDRRAREPRQPDRRDGRARGGHRRDRRRLVRDPRRLLRADETPPRWRRSCAARRSPSCRATTTRRRIFMGDTGRARARLPAGDGGRAGRPEDRGDDRAGRTAAGAWRCRSSTPRSWC